LHFAFLILHFKESDMQITAENVIKFIEKVAATVKEQRDYLTQLDSAIGDADHGVNLDRGFSTVLTKLSSVADKDIGSILKTVGTTLVSTVGGASVRSTALPSYVPVWRPAIVSSSARVI